MALKIHPPLTMAFGVKADTQIRMQVVYGMAWARQREGEMKVRRLIPHTTPLAV